MLIGSNTLTKEITDCLKESIGDIQAVYLFGSMANGTSNTQSDVDVAVLALKPLTADERWTAGDALSIRLGRNVDLVDMRRTSTVIRQQIVAKGILIFDGDPRARIAYETFVYSSYARLNEERRDILEAVRREGSIYGG